MKNLVLKVMAAWTLCLSCYAGGISSYWDKTAENYDQVSTKLSSEQLSLITGQGCGFPEWAATITALALCAASGFGGPGAVLICVTGLGGFAACLTDGDFDPNGPIADPCPASNGGGVEEEEQLCQQLGGTVIGATNPARNSRVCCQY